MSTSAQAGENCTFRAMSLSSSERSQPADSPRPISCGRQGEREGRGREQAQRRLAPLVTVRELIAVYGIFQCDCCQPRRHGGRGAPLNFCAPRLVCLRRVCLQRASSCACVISCFWVACRWRRRCYASPPQLFFCHRGAPFCSHNPTCLPCRAAPHDSGIVGTVTACTASWATGSRAYCRCAGARETRGARAQLAKVPAAPRTMLVMLTSP